MESHNGHNVEYPQVILFGDSLTQYSFDSNVGKWGVMLANEFQRLADVISRGFSGYNSRMCRIILPRLFSEKNVSNICAFVIFLGTNDVSSGIQHVPLSEYENNLRSMIAYLESIGVSREKIILMTPPPCCSDTYAAFCESIGRVFLERDNKLISEYAATCTKVGKDNSIDVVDINTAFLKSGDWPKFLHDGLHFSLEGGVEVYNLLVPHVEKKVPKTSVIPDWKTVDPKNPELSLK